MIGNLYLRIVLSAKHLVVIRGHMMHARVHGLFGFLKFCKLVLNMV